VFTGIIEAVGRVSSVTQGSGKRRFGIEAPALREGLREGDSVAVDGVCLTVAALSEKGFEADAVTVTLDRTTLGGLRRADPVNLERALAVGGRLGGHFVQGHADAIATLESVRPRGDGRWIELRVPKPLLRYAVPRGSVAVQGVSLTVAELAGGRIGLSVVPHTFEHTTLRLLRPGAAVNVEMDLFAKYAERFMQPFRGPSAPDASGPYMEPLIQ
jgi:riboflavin synthase